MTTGKSYTEVKVVVWTKMTKTHGKSKHIVVEAALRTDMDLNFSITRITHTLTPAEALELAGDLRNAAFEATSK